MCVVLLVFVKQILFLSFFLQKIGYKHSEITLLRDFTMEELPARKKRGNWSEDALKLAMDAVMKKEMSERAAATTFNIPRRTLKNHLVNGSYKKKLGRKCTLTEDLENDLAARIVKFAHIGMPLTPKVIRKQAYTFCKAHNIENQFNEAKGTAGKKWLQNFLKRHPEISKRKAQVMNPARAQKLNKFIVGKHFEAIKEIYDNMDISNHPERLYNVDEKGCRLTLHHQQQVLARKGARRIHLVAQEHAENVTIAVCVNATGTAIPPMILFKGKRLRNEFTENLPPGSLVKMAPKGSMTTELFIEFIIHLAQFKSPGKCLLVFDGASSHLDYQIVDVAEKNDIILYCLPSNTTHELQPLDKSVNKSFEHYWDEEVLLYTYQHPAKKITKARFNKILTKVWPKCMTMSNIINGFKATGLFPWDPNMIPEEAYAPSVLTEKPLALTLTSPVTHRGDQNESDTDGTYCDELGESPSLLVYDNEIREILVSPLHGENEINESTTPFSEMPTNERTYRLVNYSSSSESKENIYNSPKPGTSGIQRPSVMISSPSDTSDIDMTLFYSSYHSSKRFRIYSSSSESNNENIWSLNEIIDRGEKTPSPAGKLTSKKSQTTDKANNIGRGDTMNHQDDPDDIPLSRLLEKDAKKTAFQQMFPTPNFAVIKSKPTRKALNYIGQRVTKDLFQDKINQTKEKQKKPREVKQMPKKLKEKQKINKKKSKVQAKIKQKDRKEGKGATNQNKVESWYCHACNADKIADMRQCKNCRIWFHEECVGLTKEDTDDFVCSFCV